MVSLSLFAKVFFRSSITKRVILAKDKEKLFLTIKGGDAAESYMDYFAVFTNRA